MDPLNYIDGMTLNSAFDGGNLKPLKKKFSDLGLKIIR